MSPFQPDRQAAPNCRKESPVRSTTWPVARKGRSPAGTQLQAPGLPSATRAYRPSSYWAAPDRDRGHGAARVHSAAAAPSGSPITRRPPSSQRVAPRCRSGRSNYLSARCLMVAECVSAARAPGGRGDRRQLVMWSDTTMALPSSGRGITAPHTGQLTDNMKATVIGG